MTNLEPIMQVLLQFPLVGVFIWFTLEIMKRHEALAERREIEWREFLREERVAFHATLTRLAEEIKGLTLRQGETQAVLIAHDAHTAQVIKAVLQGLDV